MAYRRKRYSRKRSYKRRRFASKKGNSKRMFAVAKRATVSVLNKRVERKINANLANSGTGVVLNSDVSNALYPLFGISIGDNPWNRTGSSIFCKWLVLKGFFVPRSNFAAPGMCRVVKVRIMLIKTASSNASYNNAANPAYIFGNSSHTDIDDILFVRTPSNAVPVSSVFNTVDHRNGRYHVVYDRTFTARQDSVSTTVDYKPPATGFRCAVRINRKIKYKDQPGAGPNYTQEGYTYIWFILPWSPYHTGDCGALQAASYVYYTDS